MHKFTRWFPSKINPTHVGVYEISLNSVFSMQLFSFWNGTRWLSVDSAPVFAATATKKSSWIYGKDSNYHLIGWRGLAQQPK